jgi:intein-encoded DNA endonuclease-like protein
MAYVLGYFCADGCMFINSGGSQYISFVSIDKELLEKIKWILKSTHKIAPKRQERPNCKPTFWIQIGCKEIYADIKSLGLSSKKEHRLKLPSIPSPYLRHFLRGYFDGDGCITFGSYKRKNRKSKTSLVTTRFASASREFLADIKQRIGQLTGIKGGFITRWDSCNYLVYAKSDSKRLFRYMYNKINSDFYLKRKYNSYSRAFHNN